MIRFRIVPRAAWVGLHVSEMPGVAFFQPVPFLRIVIDARRDDREHLTKQLAAIDAVIARRTPPPFRSRRGTR